MPALPITPEIASLLERAEACHLTRQVEIFDRLRPELGAHVMSVAGGVAAFTTGEFGRKLNHATGCGLDASLTEQELIALEKDYARLGLVPEIDLCPLAKPDGLESLASRDYRVNAFSNTYVKTLDHLSEPPANPTVEVEVIAATNREDFIAASIAGFSTEQHLRPTVLLQTLAQIATMRGDTHLYVARINGEIAGTAGLALIDLPGATIAHLYIASTLAAYRGRGVQPALIQARLENAKRAGARLASICARPANTSARNASRAGFELAYTKSTFTLRNANR